jgi:hypothetical protein
MGIHMQTFSWRRKFIDLSESIFRELGFPPPSMVHEDSLPLAMELEVSGMDFELLHSSSEQADRILVICRLGPLPDEGVTSGLRRLLQANLTLARTHEACYGINPTGDQVQCMYYETLETAKASAMLEGMRQIATDATSWKDEFFINGRAASNAEAFHAVHSLA